MPDRPLAAALTAALDLFGDGPASSVSVHATSIAACVLDPVERRALADDLGADPGHAGELLVEVFGKADAEDWRRRDEQQWGETLAARAVAP